jgi:TatD DNase family protein
MEFIDSHCHLPSLKNRSNLEKIIDSAEEVGVTKFINIGTSLEENTKVLETSLEYQNVFATAAIYPHEDLEFPLKNLYNYLRVFVEENEENLVGIGETGIDVTDWSNGRSVIDQIALFEFQVQLAQEFNLPLIIHNRDGDKEILEVLENVHLSKGVFHCFSSSWGFAKKVLDLGFYISFSGFITYNSRDYLLETVEKVPLDRFLIETDSPYLPPSGHRGERNEPKYVRIVAQKVAEVKNIPLDQVAAHSVKNAQKLFDL